jgi:hypothetical protein
MNFKKPKEEVAADAAQRAMYTIQTQLHQLTYGGSFEPSSVTYILTQAISLGIKEAMLSMMEDVYTDAEFEQDIGLKD